MSQNVIQIVSQMERRMHFPESESSTIEWKQELPHNDQIVKTLIGFCNQNGGKIVIGVDNEGRIVGLVESKIQQILESIEKTVFESTTPSIIPRTYVQRFEEKSVLVIEVSEGMNKPYYRTSEGIEKGTYIRLGRSTLRATHQIRDELQWQSRGIDFESLPVYKATKDDLNYDEIEQFLKVRKNHRSTKLTDKVLLGYRLITTEHNKIYPTVAGILLFGKHPQYFFSEGMIISTHFHGISGREVMATIDCEGTLFNQFQQAFSFILSRLTRSFSIRGLKRQEVLEVPEVAIREALLNAIIHRNYHMKGPIKIAIFEDRIEFFSPGQFPGPLDIRNLRAGITYLRNPIICKVLREAGYVEKMGTGFITIFDAYEERGLLQPQIIEGENHIKCLLPRGKGKKSELKREKGALDKVARLMQLIGERGDLSLQEVAEALNIPRATAARKLKVLLDAGLIQKSGRTRSARYRISSKGA